MEILGSHPRLKITPDDVASLVQRCRQHPCMARWLAQLKAEAVAMLDAPPASGGGLDAARLVLDRIHTLGLFWLLEHDRRWVERAWLELSVAIATPWRPEHFLDCAEAVHAFAIGLDWLHDAWDAKQREALHAAIWRHGLEHALPAWGGRGLTADGWISMKNNWCQVCYGAMAIGAMALDDPRDAAVREEAITQAVAHVPVAMAGIGPEGEFDEGPGYWRYASEYAVALWAALTTAYGDDRGLGGAGWSRLGSFPLHLCGPSGELAGFSDTVNSRISAPHLFLLANRFNRPELARLQAAWARPQALDLLWCDPAHLEAQPQLPFDVHFRHHQVDVTVMRSSWSDPGAAFAAFKAGNCDGGHLHLDHGSFVYEVLGRRWVVELGTESYDMPGVWSTSGPRWTHYRLRAEGHNTLVIDPTVQPDQDHRCTTTLTSGLGGTSPWAIAELTPAYPGRARNVRRGLRLIDRRSLLIQDEVATDGRRLVCWSLHTPATITVADDGRAARLELDGVRLEARLLDPPDASFIVLPATPRPGTPNPPNQRSNETMRKLAVEIDGNAVFRLAVHLAPEGDAPIELLPLAAWR